MAVARRWTDQDRYNELIGVASKLYGVPVSLIKAVIAAESSFNAEAKRAESPRPSLPPTADFPAGGDMSYGLMQLLSRTARGLGYTGTLDGLLDPATNIRLGTRLLGQNLKITSGALADSVSAYNGGFRPAIGYGAVRADGTYGNQQYVNKILSLEAYFRAWDAQQTGGGGPESPIPFPDDAGARDYRGAGNSGAPMVAPDAEARKAEVTTRPGIVAALVAVLGALVVVIERCAG